MLAGASWEIDLWGRVRRLTESARANLLATEQAQRGVVLSLVAQVASAYLQLRGLDAQLEIANNTLASYGKTLELFQLQYKYGQVPKLNVEQARSSYETAAAQIPQIESQIAQTEDCALGPARPQPERHPARQTIQIAGYRRRCRPVCRRNCSSAGRISRKSEQNLIAANAQIGAAKALVLSDDLVDRRLWQPEHRPEQTVLGVLDGVELCGTGDRPDLHRRRDQGTSGAGNGGAEGRRCSTMN